MNFKWKIKYKFWHISTRILDRIKSPKKSRHELIYWIGRKVEEGILSNLHYKYFYTEHFGLDKSFYNGKKLLDIGCGPRGSLEWANMASERIGLDPLVESYKALGINKHKMKYVNGKAEDIPFEDGHFDVVSSFNSLDHTDDLDRAISEIKRVLAPRGLFLLLTDVNHDPTICEPIRFSWTIVSKFSPDLRIVNERHFEKYHGGMYESILANVSYDHLNLRKRYGILSLLCIKESK